MFTNFELGPPHQPTATMIPPAIAKDLTAVSKVFPHRRRLDPSLVTVLIPHSSPSWSLARCHDHSLVFHLTPLPSSPRSSLHLRHLSGFIFASPPVINHLYGTILHSLGILPLYAISYKFITLILCWFVTLVSPFTVHAFNSCIDLPILSGFL